MKAKVKGMPILTLFVAIVLLTIAFMPSAAALTASQESQPIVNSSISSGFTSICNEDQKAMISAVMASNLTSTDKAKMIKKLNDMWSNKSKLSSYEQQKVIAEVFPMVIKYYGIDKQGSDSGIQPMWAGYTYPGAPGTHNDLARCAGAKMGVPSQYCDILFSHAVDPDTQWPYSVDHYYFVVDNQGGAPYRCQNYMIQARNLIKNNNPTAGYECLSDAMHFMSDVANPWHTVYDGATTHSKYETYVNDHWNDVAIGTSYGDSKTYNQSIQTDWYYYYIPDGDTNVVEAVKNMGRVSNQYFAEMETKVQSSDTGWYYDNTVIGDTKTVLVHAVRYDAGLVDWARR